VYEKMADLALIGYQASLGSSSIPTYLDQPRLKALGQRMGAGLLGVATRFASRPSRPTPSMLLCDLGVLHHGGGAVGSSTVIVMPAPAPVVARVEAPVLNVSAPVSSPPVAPTPTITSPPQSSVGKVTRPPTTGEPTFRPGTRNDGTDIKATSFKVTEMTPASFGVLLGQVLVEELSGIGSERHTDMGGP